MNKIDDCIRFMLVAVAALGCSSGRSTIPDSLDAGVDAAAGDFAGRGAAAGSSGGGGGAVSTGLAGRGGAAGESSARTVTVTVTLASGERTEGRLVRIDDFLVTVALADGTMRTFRRDGDVPKVDVHDPMQAHRDLLAVYSDKDMHDVTAYLVTLK